MYGVILAAGVQIGYTVRMAEPQGQRIKCGNKHGSNVNRSWRKYGKVRTGVAKFGARAVLHNRQTPGAGLARHVDSEGIVFRHTRVPADFLRA